MLQWCCFMCSVFYFFIFFLVCGCARRRCVYILLLLLLFSMVWPVLWFIFYLYMDVFVFILFIFFSLWRVFSGPLMLCKTRLICVFICVIFVSIFFFFPSSFSYFSFVVSLTHDGCCIPAMCMTSQHELWPGDALSCRRGNIAVAFICCCLTRSVYV